MKNKMRIGASMVLGLLLLLTIILIRYRTVHPPAVIGKPVVVAHLEMPRRPGPLPHLMKTKRISEPGVQEKLKNALRLQDLKHGLVISLADPETSRKLKMYIKEINGTRCVKIEDMDGSGKVSFLSNSDGVVYSVDGKIIRAKFFNSQINSTASQVGSRVNPITAADSYNQDYYVSADGTTLEKITQTYSDQKIFQGQVALAQVTPKSADEGVREEIARALPTASVFVIDPDTGQVVSQYQTNASGEQVGSTITFDSQTQTVPLSDDLFASANSPETYTANSPAEFKAIVANLKNRGNSSTQN